MLCVCCGYPGIVAGVTAQGRPEATDNTFSPLRHECWVYLPACSTIHSPAHAPHTHSLTDSLTQLAVAAARYPQVPGIHTQEQVEAWKPVVAAVEAKGGLFLCQLWHVGRASHPDYQPGNGLPVSASAVPIGDGFEVYTPKGGPFKYPTPRALETEEIPGIIKAYADAAKNAVAAGFDGVEVGCPGTQIHICFET